MKQYINVWVEHPMFTLDALVYQCDFHVEKGMRVRVPLRNKDVVGLVSEVNVVPPQAMDIKQVVEVLDKEPIFSRMQFELLAYLHTLSVSPSITLLKAMLPTLLKPALINKKPTKERFAIIDDPLKATTPRQQEIISELKTQAPLIYKEYRKLAKGLALPLVEKGAVKIIEKDKQYHLIDHIEKEPFLTLNAEQQVALDAIRPNESHTYLLHGVTGSGKTEVFMHAVKQCLEAKQTAMVLVPEVALTPQMIARFSARFDCQIIVYHSYLSDNEQYHQYMQIKANEANIIIGTRSAIFLPLTNIGIIILDEEHDLSYKQDSAPYYHARDVAMFLSEKHACPLVLASATPALESYARALKGVYTLLQLKHRINQSQSTLHIVNMQASIKAGFPFISELLQQKMQATLAKNEQIILLLNRRGYAPHVYCDQCYQIALCPDCELPLTYHHHDKKLHCHACQRVFHHYKCSHCEHERFVGSGLATQRLETMIQSMFKGVRVGRLDYDSTRQRHGHQKILDDFTAHQFDVLIGTQMVAKGLDIPNVTLVGVLQADSGLLRNDFHSNETTYAMIHQAAGRSGRHNKHGEVIVQVFNEDHYVIKAIASQSYELFFKHEMRYRQLAKLPPYVFLISCVISANKASLVQSLAYELHELLVVHDMHVVGPSDLGQRRQRHRMRVLIKTKTLQPSIEKLKEILQTNKTIWRHVSINVAPLYLE